MKDFAELAEPLVALTRKGVPFVWTDRQQTAFEALKTCLISAPILGFPTEDGRFLLDMNASLFAVVGGGGVLNQLQDDREVVIAHVSHSLRLSQQRYCTMCTHFRSYRRGAQFTLRTDHSSLRWLQKFRNEDGMLARWLLLNIVWEPSMPMRMVCPDSAGGARGRIVRFPRQIRWWPI